MAATDVLRGGKGVFMSFSPFDHRRGESTNTKSQDVSIEKKIEFLESLAGRVSNRRSRRWLNDRLLMELVPRLQAEEIRGLFAPPPFGDDIPLSPFCMTNVMEWDKFRNVDMDKEAFLIEALETSPSKKRDCIDVDKAAVLNAWHRVDCRTRDAICRSFLPDLIKGYEDCVRAFIMESREDVLVLHVEDPFYRLLLHGVCEFYNLVSVTDTELKGADSVKATRIKKGRGCREPHNITLSQFLKMTKEGIW